MSRRSWWQENRLWLAVLPLCLAAAAAASSYNVERLWYRQGLHHEVAHAEQNRWLEVHQPYEDAVGRTSRTFEVRLRGTDPTALWPYELDGPRTPPEGVDAVVAYLDWSALPDQQLVGCYLALEDDDGRRYETTVADSSDLCTPDERPGPSFPDRDADQRPAVPAEEARPRVWSTAPVFLVPKGRRITGLLMSWGTPDYVRISVS